MNDLIIPGTESMSPYTTKSFYKIFGQGEGHPTKKQILRMLVPRDASAQIEFIENHWKKYAHPRRFVYPYDGPVSKEIFEEQKRIQNEIEEENRSIGQKFNLAFIAFEKRDSFGSVFHPRRRFFFCENIEVYLSLKGKSHYNHQYADEIKYVPIYMPLRRLSTWIESLDIPPEISTKGERKRYARRGTDSRDFPQSFGTPASHVVKRAEYVISLLTHYLTSQIPTSIQETTQGIIEELEVYKGLGLFRNQKISAKQVFESLDKLLI